MSTATPLNSKRERQKCRFLFSSKYVQTMNAPPARRKLCLNYERVAGASAIG